MLCDSQATVVMEGTWHANVANGGLFAEHEAEGSVPVPAAQQQRLGTPLHKSMHWCCSLRGRNDAVGTPRCQFVITGSCSVSRHTYRHFLCDGALRRDAIECARTCLKRTTEPSTSGASLQAGRMPGRANDEYFPPSTGAPVLSVTYNSDRSLAAVVCSDSSIQVGPAGAA